MYFHFLRVVQILNFKCIDFCVERVRDDFVSRVEQLIFASVGQPSLKSKQAANVFRHFKIFELQMYRFL